jgi:hypothetical protein
MAQNETSFADLGDASKRQEMPDWKSSYLTPKNIYLGSGCALLTLLALVPIWNSFILLTDSNYVFWVGRSTPKWIIAICVCIIMLYALTITLFFRKQSALAQTEQTVMMIGNIFITLFGIFLLMASAPLTHQADLSVANLLHRCETSEQTHRLYQYSQVLQTIRATPACASKGSVEECDGFEEAAPYTDFLRGMENNFHCAAFCQRMPVAMLGIGDASAAAPAPSLARSLPASASSAAAAMVNTRKHMRHRHTDHMTKVSLIADGAHDKDLALMTTASAYPPTLFSKHNFQASCEGMAARDMKNFAGDIGLQTFYQGIYLVVIAITTGFLQLLGFCSRKA